MGAARMVREPMEDSMQVSLTPKLEKLLRAKVESGLYENESEVVRAALRLLAARDEVQALKLERLRQALRRGEADIDAGRVTRLASDEDLDTFFARL